MRPETKANYKKIVAFIELGNSVEKTAEILNCSPRTVSDAVSWARKTFPDYLPESALFVAIRQREALIRKYETRWQELRKGIRLKSVNLRQNAGTKPGSGRKAIFPITPPLKTTVSDKFIHPVIAEVSYAGLIRDIQNDLIRLRGLKATRQATAGSTGEVLSAIRGENGGE